MHLYLNDFLMFNFKKIDCVICQDLEAQYTSSNDDVSSENESQNELEMIKEEDTCDVINDENDDSEIDSELLELYCPACKKSFKTIKS